MAEKLNIPKLELVDSPPVPSIFDDLDALRKETVIKVKRKLVNANVVVGKPKNNIYFRCHPTVSFDRGAVVMGGEGSDDFYYVAPAMQKHHAIASRLREVIIAAVYSWPSGAISLWPVPKVEQDSSVACWKSARMAYERSMEEWVQMVWNAEKRDYDVVPAEGINIEPLWPSDLNLGHLMKVGFAAKLIETPEHPYVLQLRGLAT